MSQPTEEGLEKLRHARPLADLGAPDFERTFWAPGPVDGRTTFVTAPAFFEARRLAAIDLGVEPGLLVSGAGR